MHRIEPVYSDEVQTGKAIEPAASDERRIKHIHDDFKNNLEIPLPSSAKNRMSVSLGLL